MEFEPKRDYPIGARRPDLVATPAGVPLTEVTLETVRAGHLDGRDLRVTSKTLRLQSSVARSAGREPLAANLERAAELAAVPDELLLAVYTALRPRRATASELEEWAGQLDRHGATRTAEFVREAAGVYADRGLLADA